MLRQFAADTFIPCGAAADADVAAAVAAVPVPVAVAAAATAADDAVDVAANATVAVAVAGASALDDGSDDSAAVVHCCWQLLLWRRLHLLLLRLRYRWTCHVAASRQNHLRPAADCSPPESRDCPRDRADTEGK